MKDEYIPICPHCGNTEMDTWEGGRQFCKKCNREGIVSTKNIGIIEVKKKDLKKFREEIKKKPLV